MFIPLHVPVRKDADDVFEKFYINVEHVTMATPYHRDFRRTETQLDVKARVFTSLVDHYFEAHKGRNTDKQGRVHSYITYSTEESYKEALELLEVPRPGLDVPDDVPGVWLNVEKYNRNKTTEKISIQVDNIHRLARYMGGHDKTYLMMNQIQYIQEEVKKNAVYFPYSYKYHVLNHPVEEVLALIYK